MQDRRRPLAALLALVASATLATPAGAVAPGHVYVETNAPAAMGGNAVAVWSRAADGTLTRGGTYPTHGNGSAASPPLGFPLTDSQNAVTIAQGGRLVFAVNSGSDTVTSFRAAGGSLLYVDQKPSRGRFPISVAASLGRLYVLDVDPNADNSGGGANPTLTGYRYDAKGHLTAIPHSTRRLTPRGLPGAVAFDQTGSRLVVTERDAGKVTTFRVRHDGTLSPGVSIRSQGASPFGVAVTARHQAVVADFGDPAKGVGGSVSSYDLGPFYDPINTFFNGQQASCWVAMAKDDRFAFVSSAISGSVTVVRILANGHVYALPGLTRHVNGFALDDDLTNDARFLYVLAASPPGFVAGTTDHLEGFRVGPNGELTPLGPIPGTLPPNASGLQAT